MKRFLSLILVLMMITCAAHAQETATSDAFNGYFLAENEVLKIDLDGNGEEESVLVRPEGIDEEQILSVYITAADGGVHRYDTFLVYSTDIVVCDLDGNGKLEILVSGDIYSDDYSTWCLNYDDEVGITALMFEDAGRGENTGDYYEYGYGKLKMINGNELTLLGSQDVLGTWMSTRVFKLEDGQFSLSDDGLWRMEEVTIDSGLWDYFHLTLMQDMPVKLEDGSEGTLKAGDEFVVTQSDKVSIVYFETADGVKGSFAIEPDVESGWGSIINGISENDYFEYVPYAD